MLAPFPTKRISACALIRNASGSILIVKPTYRDGWLLPGGIVEEDESPADALYREVREEVSVECRIEALLCVDYLPRCEAYDESIHFLFACAMWAPERDPMPSVDGIELREACFVEWHQALDLLVPTISRRLITLAEKAGPYLQTGRSPGWQI